MFSSTSPPLNIWEWPQILWQIYIIKFVAYYLKVFFKFFYCVTRDPWLKECINLDHKYLHVHTWEPAKLFVPAVLLFVSLTFDCWPHHFSACCSQCESSSCLIAGSKLFLLFFYIYVLISSALNVLSAIFFILQITRRSLGRITARVKRVFPTSWRRSVKQICFSQQ